MTHIRTRTARRRLATKGEARCSLLLTACVIGGAAWLGHLLCIQSGGADTGQIGLQVVSILPQRDVRPIGDLPTYQKPTEQSVPNIAPLPPAPDTAMPNIPDICTTPEETQMLLPLFDFPESLPPLPTSSSARKSIARHTSASRPGKQAPLAASNSSLAAAITPPRYKTAPPPPYPAEMKATRTRGSVRVRITVSPTGAPTAVQITAGSGHRAFDSLAGSWILQHWRFFPALSNGVPVESSVSTRVEFILDKA